MIYIFLRDTFSVRLKELRINHNLKQKELGQITGISEAAISRFEAGNRTPSMDVALALADYFDVSLDYLVGRSDDPTRR